MKIRRYVFFLSILLYCLPVFAQVDTAWVRRYNGLGNGFDQATSLAVDKVGNVYVNGLGWGSGTSHDYTTIKYTPNGDTLWVRRYNGPGNGFDYAYALALDTAGSVYVTGVSPDGGFGTGDYATIKYAPNGDTLWVRRYDGEANGLDQAFAIAVNNASNVCVAGYSLGSGTNNDYVTIKYAPNGDTLWVRRYNGPGNGWDQANAVAIDSAGNVYVTGWVLGSGTSSDYNTIKYASNGDTLWVRPYNGPTNFQDEANALVVDNDGNVYVTGQSAGVIGLGLDYVTIKYAPNGDTLWVRRYNGPVNGAEEASALAVDDAGNVYVTGRSHGSGTGRDYATIKYDSNGTVLWTRRYNGPDSLDDEANALAVDDAGNIFVTGHSVDSATSADYATIKYAPNGDTLWVRRYNGPGDLADLANALAVDNTGNVYVTGSSYGSGTSADYATIKYVECLAKPGDANADGNITLPDIIYLVNRVFKGGPAPSPMCRGDANADGSVTLPDIIYVVNRVFKGGPAPIKNGVCCL